MLDKKSNTIIPSLSIILAGFGYSLYGPLSRIVGDSFGPNSQILVRSILRVAIIVVIIFISRSKLKKVNRSDIKWFGLLGLASSFTTLFYIPAIINLPFGLTMFLFYGLGTVSSYIAGVILFHEKINRAKLISLFLALLGLIFMFIDSIHFNNSLYVIFACLAGFCYGLYSPFSKTVSRKYSLTQVSAITIIYETVIYAVAWFIFQDVIVVTTMQPWLMNFIYALDVVIIMYLVFYGFRHLEAQVGSILILSEILFILVLGFIFYHEIPSLTQLIGGGFISLSMILPQFIKT